MPLNLTINHLDTSASSTTKTNHHLSCFVHLPTDIAHSLNTLEPFSSLVILSIRHPQTISKLIYFAWDGSAIQNPSTLSIHPTFANILNLHQGDSAAATVTERIISNIGPKYPLLNAIVTPISSDEDQYETLNVTAETLQLSFLSCIRVLYKGLNFPLLLPAGRVINLNVISVSVLNHTDNIDIPYAIVMPDSSIEIQPSSSNSVRRQHDSKPFYANVIALPLSSFSGTPSSILRTHAILHNDLNNIKCVIISNKQGNDNIAIPVSALSHNEVPKGHISLPSHVWHTLCLSPFATVIVEPINKPSRKMIASAISMKPEKILLKGCAKSIDEIASVDAVCYDGMRIENGILFVDKNNKDKIKKQVIRDEVIEQWDDVELKKPDDEIDMVHVSWLTDALFINDDGETKSPSISELSSRRLLKALLLGNSSASISISTGMSIDNLPWSEEVHRKELIQNLTPSISCTVTSILSYITKRHNQTTMATPVIIIKGISGTGRTTICKTIASIIRNVQHKRTFWLRGKVHADDDILLKLKRIQLCFEAAFESNGLIIMDDFNIFCEGSDRGEERSEEEIEKSKESEQLIGEWIKGMCEVMKKRKMNILVIIVCERIEELVEDIRVPGIIGYVCNVPNTNEKDRSFMLYHAFLRYNENKMNVKENARVAVSLGKLCEHFCVFDVSKCIQRTNLLISSSSTTTNIEDILKLFEETISSMTPIHRLVTASTTTKPKNEHKKLSWNQLGGIQKVRKKISEHLYFATKISSTLQVPLKLSSGILIYGPPGCGKTIIALTSARSLNIPVIQVNGAEPLGKYIGQSEGNVRKLFEEAKLKAPSMLLFDDFDALALKRGIDSGGSGVSDRVVNTLLACIDGVDRSSEGVVVVATSSRPDIIDSALLRPGRIDRWIHVDFPGSVGDRLDILFKVLISRWTIGNDGNIKEIYVMDTLKEIAKGTSGYTGADLEGIVNEAINNVLELNDESDNEEEDVEISNVDEEGGYDIVEADEEIVAKALMEAWKDGRPSLSSKQREQFDVTMRGFGGETVDKQQVGRKLTLK